MAKAVADVNNPEEKQGGFASDDSEITGFSHMHDSGTGGVYDLIKVVNRADLEPRHLRSGTSPFSRKPDALAIS